jgi:hypothetical protein
LHLFQILDILLFEWLEITKKSIQRNKVYFPKLDHVIHIFLVYRVVTTNTIIQSFGKSKFQIPPEG